MGERTAYRVKLENKEKREISPYLRQQWGIHINKGGIEKWIEKIAQYLCGTEDATIGDGLSALRSDLAVDTGRLFNAILNVTSNRRFNSIYRELPPDVSNHGVVEIEIVEWDEWHINHIPVKWDKDEGEEMLEDDIETIAKVEFEEGKTVEEGMDYEWMAGEDDWF